MNEFQGIESGQGLLKKDYDPNTPVSNALRKRTDKLKEKTITPTKDELELEEDVP